MGGTGLLLADSGFLNKLKRPNNNSDDYDSGENDDYSGPSNAPVVKPPVKRPGSNADTIDDGDDNDVGNNGSVALPKNTVKKPPAKQLDDGDASADDVNVSSPNVSARPKAPVPRKSGDDPTADDAAAEGDAAAPGAVSSQKQKPKGPMSQAEEPQEPESVDAPRATQRPSTMRKGGEPTAPGVDLDNFDDGKISDLVKTSSSPMASNFQTGVRPGMDPATARMNLLRLKQAKADGAAVDMPDPSTYLSDDAIRSHQDQFKSGAAFFITKSNFTKFRGKDGSTGRDDGQFVLPEDTARQIQGDMKQMKAQGKSQAEINRAMEKRLGLPDGSWGDEEVLAIKQDKPGNLRIPSGNESGAYNGFWHPGGKLPTGDTEAVVDKLKPGSYRIERLTGEDATDADEFKLSP